MKQFKDFFGIAPVVSFSNFSDFPFIYSGVSNPAGMISIIFKVPYQDLPVNEVIVPGVYLPAYRLQMSFDVTRHKQLTAAKH